MSRTRSGLLRRGVFKGKSVEKSRQTAGNVDSAVTSKLNSMHPYRLLATLRNMYAGPSDGFAIVRNNSIQPKALKMMVVLD
jgi:hypothetical protein